MATAPKTIITVALTGQREFTIPFEYLTRRFVVVTLLGADRKVLTLGTDYRFVSKTVISLLTDAPAQYTHLELRRNTSATDRLVDFRDGSILRAGDLNLSQLQTLHIAEEARDLAFDIISITTDGNLDARGKRIVNVANGEQPNDAVNLFQLRNTLGIDPQEIQLQLENTTHRVYLRSQLKSSVSVLNFGAVGDGVTDDTAALQTALDSPYKRIWFPKGTYRVTDTLTIPDGKVLSGDDMWTTIIKMDASVEGSKDLAVNAAFNGATPELGAPILIEDVQFHANGRARTKTVNVEWGRALRIGCADRPVLRRCVFREGPQHCLDICNWKDQYLGIGHNGVSQGMTTDARVYNSVMVDWVYDDGLTTHSVKGCLIRDCVAIVTDEAKTFRRYTMTQNGFEVDDGSEDVLVDGCTTWGNHSGTKGFSVATHKNAPAARNVKFSNIVAHGVTVGVGFWADADTDATHGSADWSFRHFTVENFVNVHPALDVGNSNFPSRLLDVQSGMHVTFKNISLEMGDRMGGAPRTSVCTIHISNAIDVEYDGISIRGVKDDRVEAYPQGSPWFRLTSNAGAGSDNIRIRNVYIDNMGWTDRVIRDIDAHPKGGAVRELHNIEVKKAGGDGRTKTVYVGAGSFNASNIEVPTGMYRYQIGRTLANTITNSNGNVKVNYQQPDFVAGGFHMRSITAADGSQPCAALLFDRYFVGSNPANQQGKGTLAFRTSADVVGTFSISAYHEDTGVYKPIVQAYSSSNSEFASWKPVYSDFVALGEASARYTGVYLTSSPNVTSDRRAKQDIEAMTAAELAVGLELASAIKTYRYRDAVKRKQVSTGASYARTHTGIIAQEVVEIFEKHGLDAYEYGIVCYDEWDAEYQDVFDENEKVIGKVKLKDAGDGFSIRYDELSCFMIAALASKE